MQRARPRPDPWPCCSCPGRICTKLAKRRFWFSAEMPGPSSRTDIARVTRESSSPTGSSRSTLTSTWTVFPSAENLMALLSRLLITCSTRYLSPTTRSGTSSAILFTSEMLFALAEPRKVENTLETASLMEKGQRSSSNLPSSIFCMLSTSFKVSHMKSEAPFIINSDSLSEVSRLLLRSKISIPIVREFRGVRTSWKMYFRNARRASLARCSSTKAR
mmetsp:Transcript_17509/g.25317  ORF Transcript_17509/g.25317 Transcript_17509/m.25317 type:complete len:218 (-) Transcript_17509:941-1594(-)